MGLPRGYLDRPPDGYAQAVSEKDLSTLESQIDSIQYALMGVFAVLADERPAEGARIAAAIRKATPAHPGMTEFLRALLATLDKGNLKRERRAPAA